jgi:hypothetical protein
LLLEGRSKVSEHPKVGVQQAWREMTYLTSLPRPTRLCRGTERGIQPRSQTGPPGLSLYQDWAPECTSQCPLSDHTPVGLLPWFGSVKFLPLLTSIPFSFQYHIDPGECLSIQSCMGPWGYLLCRMKSHIRIPFAVSSRVPSCQERSPNAERPHSSSAAHREPI